jgi:large subunit ribosomal protein L15e
MGLYKYIREAWKKPGVSMPSLMKERLIQWRKEPTTVRLDRPTRLDRARALGYRAKPGILVVRQRAARGGRQREKFKSGRRPKTMRRKKIVAKSYQWVCEERVQKKYPNCEVLNSYNVGKDGKHIWYEVILIDRDHPVIINDKDLRGIAASRGRVFRGKTSAGRRSGKANN